MENIINLNELAEKIGNKPVKVLYHGEEKMAINWDASTAKDALKEVYPYSQHGDKVIFNGPAPRWFASALAHTVHPCPVALHDPKVGDIDIPHLPRGPENEAGHVHFNVEEGDKYVKLNWEIVSEQFPPVYNYEDLKNIVVPEIPEGKELCISGRGPNYITVALGEAYAHTNPDISYYQPQTKGYTVGVSHNPMRSVGDLIPEQEVQKDLDVKKFEKEVLEKAGIELQENQEELNRDSLTKDIR